MILAQDIELFDIMNPMITIDAVLFILACLLVWEALLLIPMIPGKLIDTRDFSTLPRWQFNSFNIFLTSLGIASFIVSGFALASATWVIIPALIIGLCYLMVFFLDLFEVFPAVEDPIPLQLLILEVIGLSSAGVIITIAVKGLLI